MTTSDTERALKTLESIMKSDWDQRIQSDYRLWMSDGVEDDSTMFATGERDFNLLARGLDLAETKNLHALEIACGVGRIIATSSKHFKHVTGIDISKVALDKAKNLLSDLTNITLVCGNGLDFGEIEDGTIDFAYSFAALSNLPSLVLSSYLNELSRVLKLGARAHLQLYFGSQQTTYRQDSLSIRCYSQEQFAKTCELIGFSVEEIYPLDMPFDAENPDAGIFPKIVVLEHTGPSTSDINEIHSSLSGIEEQDAPADWPGSHLEYLMCITRARNFLLNGELRKALSCFEFAIERYAKVEQGVHDVVKELKSAVSKK